MGLTQTIEDTELEWFSDRIKTYNPSANFDLIRESYLFGKMKHEGQKRESGEPYFVHCVETAKNLVSWRMDVDTISAGFLHDILEDTNTPPAELRKNFGDEITLLVEGVSKISSLPFRGVIESQAENFRKMILAMSKDIRVILIKLADRLHNMRTLEHLKKKESQIRIAEETMDIYAPLAHRLGMAEVSAELGSLSLQYRNPDIFNDLKNRVDNELKSRGEYTERLVHIIKNILEKADIKATVEGRRKSIYSIYQKMQNDGLSFDDINDLFAFRVLVDSEKDCYASLGIIHSKWKPIQKIKDYIAVPKTNGYQSLHTTVIGPGGKPVEIQIRTFKMHEVAEYGIAAHWRYKEGKPASQEDARFSWLRRIVENMQEINNPRQFMESVKEELFPEEVYVFTPRGDVKVLPKGATPIDFAYSVHTEVGHQCVGAKVNGRGVPLKYELQSGDIVEIITRSGGKPSRDWLRIVKSSGAKSKIRHWIREQERAESLQLGQELLETEMRERRINTKNILKSDRLFQVAQQLKFSSVEEMLIHIGYNKLSAQHVTNLFAPETMQKEEKPAVEEHPQKGYSRNGVKVGGIDHPLVRFAKCCNPIPGDEIVGFITRGRGVTIHIASCPRVADETERILDAEWADTSGETLYPVGITIEGNDKKGFLAELAAAIAKESVNIASGSLNTVGDRAATSFTIQVTSLAHLHKVMDSIGKIKGVTRVERKS